MSELEKRMAALETAVADLTQRLDEQQAATVTSPPQPARAEVGPGEIDFVLLERLQNRGGAQFDNGVSKGSVVYAGSAHTGNGAVTWHVERPVPGLLGEPAELYAPVLAVLGHPTRLQMMMILLRDGPLGSQELQDALGGSSTGQFYHHLKELQRLKLVVQPLRGYYEVDGRKAVPLLALLAAVLDLREEPVVQENDSVAPS